MGKIKDLSKIDKLIKSLKEKHKKIVLVGGCFDILHPGHVIFLQKAKKEGDVLIVLLESDEKVKKLKGREKPVQGQNDRAFVLAAFEAVDYVLPLPFIEREDEYDNLVIRIKPDIIAAVAGEDPTYLRRSARLVGAKLKFVTKMVGDFSSSRILRGTVK